MAADCIFCKIASGALPAMVVFEDADAMAFLDIAPLAPGHTLLIPKKHYRRITDMTAPTVSALSAHLPRLAAAVVSETNASGLNILQNNGEVSGQSVDHVHFHLIPRTEGDGLGYRWNAGRYASGQAEALLTRIRTALS
jgi:histidine triad (HIT) family protein